MGNILYFSGVLSVVFLVCDVSHPSFHRQIGLLQHFNLGSNQLIHSVLFFPRSSSALERLECLSLTSECWQIWWICCHHLGGLMGKAFPRGDGLHISLLLLVGKAGYLHLPFFDALILLKLIIAIRSWSSHSSLHSRLLLVQSVFLESCFFFLLNLSNKAYCYYRSNEI